MAHYVIDRWGRAHRLDDEHPLSTAFAEWLDRFGADDFAGGCTADDEAAAVEWCRWSRLRP
jgi:hypothetical protein